MPTWVYDPVMTGNLRAIGELNHSQTHTAPQAVLNYAPWLDLSDEIPLPSHRALAVRKDAPRKMFDEREMRKLPNTSGKELQDTRIIMPPRWQKRVLKVMNQGDDSDTRVHNQNVRNATSHRAVPQRPTECFSVEHSSTLRWIGDETKHGYGFKDFSRGTMHANDEVLVRRTNERKEKATTHVYGRTFGANLAAAKSPVHDVERKYGHASGAYPTTPAPRKWNGMGRTIALEYEESSSMDMQKWPSNHFAESIIQRASNSTKIREAGLPQLVNGWPNEL